jgi:hypothetical protein
MAEERFRCEHAAGRLKIQPQQAISERRWFLSAWRLINRLLVDSLSWLFFPWPPLTCKPLRFGDLGGRHLSRKGISRLC